MIILGAKRNSGITYPNNAFGYGKLDLLNSFNIAGGDYRAYSFDYDEYNKGKLFIRIPRE